MSKNVKVEALDAVIDALLLPDKKNKKERYTEDPITGIAWSDKQRKYFLMTGGYDPCVVKPSKTICIREEGGSELSLTLPDISDGYEETFKKLLKITLKFICHQNAFGPYHPCNLKQLAWILERADIED